jgi:hypothetical protein
MRSRRLLGGRQVDRRLSETSSSLLTMFQVNAIIVYVRDDDIYISRRWSFTVNPVITKIVSVGRTGQVWCI